jgi:hypothetical protein
VTKGERADRKKYEAPTVTRFAVTSLLAKARGELAHLIAGTDAETESLRCSNGEFRIVLNLEGILQSARIRAERIA